MIDASMSVCCIMLVPAQRPVSFCRISKMSLASIMKTVFICPEVRVEIFICLKLHRMLIPSLYT